MSLSQATGLGSLGQAVQGVTGVTSISSGAGLAYNANTATWTAQSMQQWQDNQHQFTCNKTENGWVFVYRTKSYIATTLDEMMELMKAAMVAERIEK